MLFNTAEGYYKNSVCLQLAASCRIQVKPMTVVSLMQMKVREALELLDAARAAA